MFKVLLISRLYPLKVYALLFALVVALLLVIIGKLRQNGLGAKLDVAKLEHSNTMILVGNVGKEELIGYMTYFCKEYNNDTLPVKLELAISNDGRMVVLFPNDVDYDIFCFAVNYLRYSVSDKDVHPEVIGWSSFAKSNTGLPKAWGGKHILAFVPNDDKEHDVVAILSSDNEAMLNSFADGNKKYKTEAKYIQPPFDTTNVTAWAKERIEIVSL